MRTVKVFLAFATSLKRRPKQADFVGAYLQAKVRGRYFVKLDARFKDLVPEHAEWFGRPLRLKKGIYGQRFSGKYWSLDFTEWLISQGFEQSTADTTYLIKHHANGAWLCSYALYFMWMIACTSDLMMKPKSYLKRQLHLDLILSSMVMRIGFST